MFLISSDCFAGSYYKNSNYEHNHPFFWCVIPPKTMIRMVTDFHNINFDDASIEKSSKWNSYALAKNTFDLILENDLRIHFVHNKLSMRDITPRTIGGDVYYRYAYKLTLDNYLRRLPRMKALHEEPKFIVMEHNGWEYTEPALSEIAKKAKFKTLIISSIEITTDNPNVTIIKIPNSLHLPYDSGRTYRIMMALKSRIDKWAV